jgi:predicted RNA-binding protein YlxR (DUF448 family)
MEPDDGSESDTGPGRGQPIRSCAVTRERMPIEALIRFVASPDGQVVPDLKRNLPGRGVWIRADKATLLEAVKRKVFARALKCEAKAGPDLAELVGRLLEKDALQSLALAKKAGLVVSGHAKVEAALATGTVIALLNARDAAADGIRKLGQAVRRRYEAINAPSSISPFGSQQMSLYLGREHVIHACLVNGAASAVTLAKCRLFLRYGGLPLADAVPDSTFGSDISDPGLLAMTPSDS